MTSASSAKVSLQTRRETGLGVRGGLGLAWLARAQSRKAQPWQRAPSQLRGPLKASALGTARSSEGFSRRHLPARPVAASPGRQGLRPLTRAGADRRAFGELRLGVLSRRGQASDFCWQEDVGQQAAEFECLAGDSEC